MVLVFADLNHQDAVDHVIAQGIGVLNATVSGSDMNVESHDRQSHAAGIEGPPARRT